MMRTVSSPGLSLTIGQISTNVPTLRDVEHVRRKQHLIDVELRLAPGHFSVAGAELADEVMAAGTHNKKWP